jgi:hypothetical protein
MTEAEQAPPEPAIDWREVARAALSSAVVAGLVGGALKILDSMLRAHAEDGIHPDFDSEAQRAANLLGVELDATEDEIRAALRDRLASSRLHPDQGGDGEAAKELIAAKNLLVERARLSHR